MSRMNYRYLIIALLLVSLDVFAQQQFSSIGNLKLENGQIISNCIVGYQTIGKANDDSSNIILYPTWFGGKSAEIISLIAKYQFIDTSKFLIIAVDALGDGISSSPSNSDQTPFPIFSIRDMVNSQYKMLTENLGINHLRAIVGGSMGSFQAFEWSVTYPDFMDKVLPYVCSPRLSSYELLYMNARINVIETCRKNNMSDFEINKILSTMTAISGHTPEYIVEKYDRNVFPEYWDKFNSQPSETFTVDNHLSQLKAMAAFDITKYFDYSLEEAAENINAEFFIIVNKNDQIVSPFEAIKFSKFLKARILVLENKCGHIILSCEMERVIEAVNIFLEN